MTEIIACDDSVPSRDDGADILHGIAAEMGIPYEEAVRQGTNLLVFAALQAKLDGRQLEPGHADLLRKAARTDPSVASRVEEILSAMFPAQPDEL